MSNLNNSGFTAVPLKTVKKDDGTKPEDYHSVPDDDHSVVNSSERRGKCRCSHTRCYIVWGVIAKLCVAAGIGYGIWKAVVRANQSNEPFIVHTVPSPEEARHCDDLYLRGIDTDGIYNITIDKKRIEVYCEFEDTGFSWLVLQRRVTGQQDFNLNWTSYVNGFGDLNGDFWLGLENIHIISEAKWYKLRLELKDWQNRTYFSEYSTFSVGRSASKYRLYLGSVVNSSEHFGEALSQNNVRQFSTFDNDNDWDYRVNCAEKFQGGWWFKGCGPTNLNGKRIEHPQFDKQGILWVENNNSSVWNMKETKMKIWLIIG